MYAFPGCTGNCQQGRGVCDCNAAADTSRERGSMMGVSWETHDKIVNDLHRVVRGLIVANANLRFAVNEGLLALEGHEGNHAATIERMRKALKDTA